MKKYRDRITRRIAKVVNVAYLTTAILWGLATIGFAVQRENVKEEYIANKISRDEYLETCMQFTEKEEIVFKVLTMSFVATFVVDVACPECEKER